MLGFAAKGIRGLLPIRLDVTRQETVDAALQTVQAWLSEDPSREFAGLINNAGIAYNAPVELLPVEKAMEVYDVNVFGVHRLTKAFIPLLRQHKGRVINVR